jgi:hypothetical protein
VKQEKLDWLADKPFRANEEDGGLISDGED